MPIKHSNQLTRLLTGQGKPATGVFSSRLSLGKASPSLSKASLPTVGYITRDSGSLTSLASAKLAPAMKTMNVASAASQMGLLGRVRIINRPDYERALQYATPSLKKAKQELTASVSANPAYRTTLIKPNRGSNS